MENVENPTTWTLGERIVTNPVIVANIMQSLTSWRDLRNCRLVNRLWNTESRSRFLSKASAKLSTIEIIGNYTRQWEGSKGYSNFHIYFDTRWFKVNNEEKKIAWENFIEKIGPNVQTITLFLDSDNERQWNSLMTDLARLTNLTTLNIDLSEFLFSFNRGLASFRDLDQGVKGSSVKKLKIITDVLEEEYEYRDWSEGFSDWLTSTFPNVEDVDFGFTKYCPSIQSSYLSKLLETPERVKNIRGLFFSEHAQFAFEDLAIIELPLKSLKFFMPRYNVEEGELKDVLDKFAPTLEYLFISMLNSDNQHKVLMPIMPKIKELCVRYAIVANYDMSGSIYTNSRIQSVFIFENGEVNYQLQFPSLKSLTIQIETGRVNPSRNSVENESPNSAVTREEEIFEQFLPQNAICQTVNHLKVTVNVKGENRSETNYESVASRLSKVFPNAQNDPVWEVV